MAPFLDDVTNPQQRHNRKNLLFLGEYVTGYLLKVKYLQNSLIPQKREDGRLQSLPPCITEGA